MWSQSEPESLQDIRALFLVWGPPSRGARSRVLANELEIEELHFIYLLHTQSLLSLPLRYLFRSLRTVFLLWRHRPQLVLMQSPPHVGVAISLLYCILTGARYVIDAHGAAFQSPIWTRPLWLVRLLARRALVTLVTNDKDAHQVGSWGGRAMVIPDIPCDFPRGDTVSLAGEFNVVVISSHSPDEPIASVIEAAGKLPGVHFYVTGSPGRTSPALHREIPPNVALSGFLDEKDFYSLLSSCHAITCLTTRAQTMQRGACEGLWMGKPLIVSDSTLLRNYFCKGAVWVDNSPGDIQRGIRDVKERYPSYQAGIQQLQRERTADWQLRRRRLVRLMLGDAGLPN